MKKGYNFLSFKSVVIFLIAIFIFLFVYQFILQEGWESEFTKKLEAAGISCLKEGHENLKQHIHPHLDILIDGEPLEIPADIGVSEKCLPEIHTHKADGKINIESSDAKKTFTLGQFFAVWEVPFSSSRISDRVTDSNYEIKMTVNGLENNEFEKLILADEQKIVISYQKREEGQEVKTTEDVIILEGESN